MIKNLRYSILTLAFGLIFTNCDKIDNAYKQIAEIEVDESLYPGDWDYYMVNFYPTFSTNTNTNVNVLVEDYTGHTCINCPQAAIIAHGIAEAYPNRVFVASIHIDPGGVMSFQYPHIGQGKYETNHSNDDAKIYGIEFQSGFGFFGNPSGNVNRKNFGSNAEMFKGANTWQTRAETIMAENNLKVNIQSKFNYFEETNGGFLHAEFEKKTDEPLKLNAVVYVIQDSLVDWQLMPDNSDNPDYVHRDKHLGSIDGNPWGVSLFTLEDGNGDKVRLDYSYKVPDNIDKSNLHFLIYAYDVDTYEIYQVIRQDIE